MQCPTLVLPAFARAATKAEPRRTPPSQRDGEACAAVQGPGLMARLTPREGLAMTQRKQAVVPGGLQSFVSRPTSRFRAEPPTTDAAAGR